jgi:flagellar biosynthesis protein FlhF
MQMRRFIATDMRSALNQVRESLGADAVILSSRRSVEGVEIVAAVDVADTATQERAASQAAARASAERSTVRAETSSPADAETHTSTSRVLASEVKQMRRLLESQLATLAWNEFTQRSPLRAAVLRELAQFGLAQDVCKRIAEQVPENMELNRAVQLALGLLASEIQTTGDTWLERGGMVAFAGPSGVGKTTLIAKLAARWVLRHGPRSVVLVSADSARIGAHEQMHMLGRLLNVPVHTAQELGELPELLNSLTQTKLVLVDTAGASSRDNSIPTQLATLATEIPRLETALVVSVNAQAGAIAETFARFAAMRPAVCLLTKLDEATSLGGILTALERVRLPVAYCSDGTRVPEDLHPARAHALVLQAQSLARKNGATIDEDLLQRRFGALSNAVA